MGLTVLSSRVIGLVQGFFPQQITSSFSHAFRNYDKVVEIFHAIFLLRDEVVKMIFDIASRGRRLIHHSRKSIFDKIPNKLDFTAQLPMPQPHSHMGSSLYDGCFI